MRGQVPTALAPEKEAPNGSFCSAAPQLCNYRWLTVLSQPQYAVNGVSNLTDLTENMTAPFNTLLALWVLGRRAAGETLALSGGVGRT